MNIVGTFIRNWRNKQAGDRIILSHDSCVLSKEDVAALVSKRIMVTEEVPLPAKAEGTKTTKGKQNKE